MIHMTNTNNPIDFPKEWKDAIGKPIQYGQRYSYSYSLSASGVSRTVIGTAIKITKTGRVTLLVRAALHESVKRFLYGEPTNCSLSEDSDTVSIRAHLIFPINEL